MTQYQANARKCATCQYWAGERELSQSRNFVEVDPTEKGVCAGKIKNAHLSASHCCDEWEKWPALR